MKIYLIHQNRKNKHHQNSQFYSQFVPIFQINNEEDVKNAKYFFV